MPVKKPQVPDIPSYRGEDRELQSILDRVRTAISHLTKTDFVTEEDIHCKSLYVDGDSFYIGGVKMKKPIDSETGKVLAYNRTTRALEWSDDISGTVTGVPNTEQTQDIVGAMFTGNTETLIAATYQDTDGTIDLVVDEASIDHDALTNFVANEHLPGIDEDAMGSDSNVHIPTQQSVKAYVDSKAIIFTTTRIINTDSPYTILSTDHVIFCDTDGGVITVLLPVGIDGREYKIINCGSNDVTLTPNGAELLNGANSSMTFGTGVIVVTYETTEGWW